MEQYLLCKDDNNREYFILNPEWKTSLDDKRYEYFLKLSDIPLFYHNVEFEDYTGDKNSDFYKKIVYYANNIDKEKFKNVNIFLYGIHSSQKTSMACNVLKTAIRKGLKVKFVLAGSLIDKLLKNTSYNYSEDIVYFLKNLKSYDVLLIDDCFDINKGVFWHSESKSIILSAWDNFLRDILVSNTKIIMTSNFGIDNIKQNFGLAIYELIDRNFVSFQLTQSVKEIRKKSLSEVFNDIK